MGYTKDDLNKKLLEMYPEIKTYGLSVGLEFDEGKKKAFLAQVHSERLLQLSERPPIFSVEEFRTWKKLRKKKKHKREEVSVERKDHSNATIGIENFSFDQ